MEEFFWFFLGAFVYLVINGFISFLKKVQFISDIKIYSFLLIGFAYEQLIFAMAAKYMILESDPDADKEKIKLFKNDDEAAFGQWKKNVVRGLRDSVPPLYRTALEVENWDDLMETLDQHYKKVLREKRIQKEGENNGKDNKIEE